MNNEFTYASLFAGIGGFESGLNKLGGRNVFASEIDKFARQSYEVLYGVEPSGDITQIESKDIPNHDLLTAGFPCQTFSVAGKRAGMAYVCRDCEHEQTISFNQYADRDFICESCGGVIEAVDGRGLLFFEVARVARDKQPKVVLLENVKGLVGHDKGRTLDTIVRTLSEIGYVVDFDVLNSKFYGVPQNRERIFVVAVREDIQPHEPWAEESRKGQTVIPKGKRRIFEYEEVKTFNFDFPTNDKVTTILRDVLEESVDEKYYLGEDRTAQLLSDLKRRVEDNQLSSNEALPLNLLSRGAECRTDGVSYALKAAEGGSSKQHVIEGPPIREVTTKGYAVAAEGDAVNFQFPNSKTRRGRVGKEIANTLEASNINRGVVEVSENVCIDDTQGFDGTRVYYDETPTIRSQRSGLKVVEVYEDVRAVLTPDRLEKRQNGRRFKEVDEEMFTLTAQDRHGVSVDNSTETRIRKLTPKECWRLQGFTDDQHDAVERAGVSNSQRYKQAGNAVTVNVIEAIGEKLLPYLQKGEI